MAGRTPQGSAFARLVMGVVIFLSLVVSGCSAKAQTLAAATPTPEPAFVATLRPKLAATMQQLGIPGAIFYVQDPHKGTWTATMGTSDVSTNAPMNVNDHMRIGSITEKRAGKPS